MCLMNKQKSKLQRKMLLLTLALLNQDRYCLYKQCRFRSDGFWRSHLIRIYTVCQSLFEFIWTNNIELSDWMKVRNGHGKLNFFSRIKVNDPFRKCKRVNIQGLGSRVSPIIGVYSIMIRLIAHNPVSLWAIFVSLGLVCMGILTWRQPLNPKC